MAVAAVPRPVVRLSVTEALCFHPFGPEQAFGGVDFASGFPWRAHAGIPALTFSPCQQIPSEISQATGCRPNRDCTVPRHEKFREYEPSALSTYFVAGTDNSHDRLSKPSMKQ